MSQQPPQKPAGMSDAQSEGMTTRSRLLLVLLLVGIVAVSLITAFTAEAAPSPEQVYENSPVLKFDSAQLRVQEAALALFRAGCLEARVLVFPDLDGSFEVYATCIEWPEVRPAAQQ